MQACKPQQKQVKTTLFILFFYCCPGSMDKESCESFGLQNTLRLGCPTTRSVSTWWTVNIHLDASFLPLKLSLSLFLSLSLSLFCYHLTKKLQHCLQILLTDFKQLLAAGLSLQGNMFNLTVYINDLILWYTNLTCLYTRRAIFKI